MPKNKVQSQRGLSLPRYLAEFCFRFNRRFHLGSMIGALVKAAAHSKPIPQHKLKLAEIWW